MYKHVCVLGSVGARQCLYTGRNQRRPIYGHHVAIKATYEQKTSENVYRRCMDTRSKFFMPNTLFLSTPTTD